jgi:Ca2+-transporting ATPase
MVEREGAMVAPALQRPWTQPVEQLLAALQGSAQGLSSAEATARLARAGPNELPEPVGTPLWREVAGQFTHFMALLLWAAGGLAFASGTPELGWAIWGVVLVNGAFSSWQERRAGRALASLRRQLPHQARAWRDGALALLPAGDLVPGDVIELGLGDLVPADARLLASERLRLDLSLLTGESAPVARSPAEAEPLCAVAAAAGSVVVAGATVVSGRGRALVYATGAATALGEVARLTEGVVREPSTLSVQVARLVRVITGLAVGMGLVVFALAYWLVGFTLPEALLFAIGIVVANVPEGLLPTVTLALALGVQRMARRRVLVRRLPAIETLSAVTVICTDKTGTLTENRMTVRATWTPAEGAPRPMEGGPLPAGEAAGPLRLLLAAGALCTEAATVAGPGPARAVARDPLESALLEAARARGLDPVALARAAPRRRELPFDPARRLMTVVVDWALGGCGLAPGAPLALVKGAPSELLARCTAAQGPAGPAALDEAGRAAALAQAERLSALGQRVIAVALARRRRAGGGAAGARHTLVGLAIHDPPRAAKTLPAAAGQTHRHRGDRRQAGHGAGGRPQVACPATPAVTGAELAALTTSAAPPARAGRCPSPGGAGAEARLVRAYRSARWWR